MDSKLILLTLAAAALLLAGCSHVADDNGDDVGEDPGNGDANDGAVDPENGDDNNGDDGNGEDPREPEDHLVRISGFAYEPPELTVVAGDTVTWTNEDAVAHTATDDDGAWNTGSIAPGGSATIEFNEPGEYSYHCQPHPNITGTITVTEA